MEIRAPSRLKTNLAGGSLRITSFARPGKLFTANKELIDADIATLQPPSLKEVVDAVVDLLRAGR